jgi:hypothetical protein
MLELLFRILAPGTWHEFIANASNGKQIAGLTRFPLNITAQTHDKVIDGSRVSIFAQIPHFLQQLFARDGTAAIVDQAAKQVGFHHRQWNDLRAYTQLQVLKVHGFVIEAKDLRRGGVGSWRNILRGRGIS